MSLVESSLILEIGETNIRDFGIGFYAKIACQIRYICQNIFKGPLANLSIIVLLSLTTLHVTCCTQPSSSTSDLERIGSVTGERSWEYLNLAQTFRTPIRLWMTPLRTLLSKGAENASSSLDSISTTEHKHFHLPSYMSTDATLSSSIIRSTEISPSGYWIFGPNRAEIVKIKSVEVFVVNDFVLPFLCL